MLLLLRRSLTLFFRNAKKEKWRCAASTHIFAFGKNDENVKKKERNDVAPSSTFVEIARRTHTFCFSLICAKRKRECKKLNIFFSKMNQLPGPIINLIAQFTRTPWIMRLNKKFCDWIGFKISKSLFSNIYLDDSPIISFLKERGKIKNMIAVFSNCSPNARISELYKTNAIIWINRNNYIMQAFKELSASIYIHRHNSSQRMGDNKSEFM